MTTQYMTGEQRAAAEAAELAQAEGQDQRTADTQMPDASQSQQVDWEKRYRDLQSYSAKQINELKSKIPAQDFETENEKLQRQVAELHQDLNARNVADKVREAQMKVAAAHPDYDRVIPSQEFATWIEMQPEVFKNAIYDEVPNAELAIRALSLFKMETQQPQQRQAQPHPASMAVRERHQEVPQELQGKKVWTYAEIQRMNPNEFAKHEAEIDKAIAEGRIK